ncbi:MAG: hypothetical protein V3T53_02530 [Phycisphaerales bacterium]
MAPFDGFLALDAIVAVAGQSAEIRAAIKAGEAETLSDRDFPPIARNASNWPEPVLIFVAVSAR